jgi:hypothetical protein
MITQWPAVIMVFAVMDSVLAPVCAILDPKMNVIQMLGVRSYSGGAALCL